MKKVKYIVHLLLVISILFTSFCTANNTVAAKEKIFDTLTFKVNSVNIKFNLTDNDDLSYDYDKALFKVDVEDEDLNRIITISKKKGAKPAIDDKVLVYIPESLPFKNVVIDCISSGMTLCEMNKPIAVNADKAAITLPLPTDFSESLNLTANSSSVVIKASKKTGINFSLKAEKSAISLPKSFAKYLPTLTEYSFTYEDGAVDITSDITSSSFTLKLK